MSKKADKSKPKEMVWVKRHIKDSVYENHWEYKLVDQHYAKRYRGGYFKRSNWTEHNPKINIQPKNTTLKVGKITIDDSEVVVKPAEKKVAKARLRIV